MKTFSGLMSRWTILVILRRAHELDRLTTPEFHELVEEERGKLQRTKKPAGGDFYRTVTRSPD